MTANFSSVDETPGLILEPPSARHSRAWMILAAFGVAAGASAAVLLALPEEAPARAPDDDLAELAHHDQAEGDEQGLDDEASPPARAAEVVARVPAVAEAPRPVAAATEHGFYVQVAAYRQLGDASEHAAALSAHGLPALASSPDDAGSWHRVRLGPFETRGDAEKARFNLKVHERGAAYVEPRSNGKYHVQVGSFATREEAEPIAQRLTAQGHVTKISRIKMGDQRWHCVRIGPFDTAEEASDYRELVKGVPGGESVVIPYGPPK